MNGSIVVGVGFLALVLCACGSTATTGSTPIPAAPTAASATGAAPDLSGVKSYLVKQANELKDASAQLQTDSNAYYQLAKSANFDYARLWKEQRPEVIAAVEKARASWVKASPLYEQMEGIVAGTPSLSQFDTDLDAGASAAEGGDNVVSFDIQLPDGTVLAKPGNLFGVTESALYGTFANYTVPNVAADFNGDGKVELGDALPDANVLQGGSALLAQKSAELATAAAAWQPDETEAFNALVANVPTVSDFFDSWKNSRFVQTDANKASRDFAAVSRLSDIQDNVTSWQTIYGGLHPLVVTVDPTDDRQITNSLGSLKQYVAGIAAKEHSGKRYTAEEADLLSADAEQQATAITGEIVQAAAKLHIKLNN